MDYIVHRVPKRQTQLSDFHFVGNRVYINNVSFFEYFLLEYISHSIIKYSNYSHS